MAVNAEQSIATNVPTNLLAACATHATPGVGASPDSGVSDIVKVSVDSSQDTDGSRSKTNVSIRRGEPDCQTDGNRRFVDLLIDLKIPLIRFQPNLVSKGGSFGIDRWRRESFTDHRFSTVSKVLRNKEKYLSQDDGSRSPAKRPKGRSPDIERALAVWAKNQVRVVGLSTFHLY